MVEVTVLGNGVVMIGYHESAAKKALREFEQEQKELLKRYADGWISKTEIKKLK